MGAAAETGRGEGAGGWALGGEEGRLGAQCSDSLGKEPRHAQSTGSARRCPEGDRDCLMGREAEAGDTSIGGSPLVLGQLLVNSRFGCVTLFSCKTKRKKYVLYIGEGC
jgi:hypothetical protein